MFRNESYFISNSAVTLQICAHFPNFFPSVNGLSASFYTSLVKYVGVLLEFDSSTFEEFACDGKKDICLKRVFFIENVCHKSK